MPKKVLPPYKSFYISPKSREELDFLGKIYGENKSAVIRRLITEAYGRLKHVYNFI